ncbi:Homoserine dehydrogenase [Maioricimonas rarisocia]|uniref:Homoserine dehydrogenase n=1 Tax=Maioricimonas rarisocia TaxID=2528026 RepID=A0A517Z6U0_9PLAN|nr:homoserine dehydrogenase [Maioricimonas rarisocia]QDU38197.1 Homoserine dehydrogenase [Maioricimonas rarisocia]
MQPLRVGLIGLGTVGTGVSRILLDHADRVTRRAGRPIELTRVAVRSLDKPREIDLPASILTDDAAAVARDPDVDVVVELIGGLSPARELVLDALAAGKDVVTANKALLCEHGLELFRQAREFGRCIAFEAAVAGGVPIIEVLGQSLAANQVHTIEAILNGTSNFILTEMFTNDAAYDDVVRKAQELGYAEADPSMDVKGTDAAQKLGLLTLLAFGTQVGPEKFPVQGIDTIELADLKYADELGYAVKLLATVKLVDGKLEMHTQPTLIRHDRPLAQVDGPNNMVALTGDAVGTTWLSGYGAGQMPTASSVAANLIDVAIGRAQLTFPHLDLWIEHKALPIQPAEEIFRRYYLRLQVDDRPHVMADITDILGRHQISLASVIQHESPEYDEQAGTDGAPPVPLVIMTHRTREGRIQAALTELDQLDCLHQPRVCMPISD